MDAKLSTAQRTLGRAGRAAVRYRTARTEIEPLAALVVDLAALSAMVYRHGAHAMARTWRGGEA